MTSFNKSNIIDNISNETGISQAVVSEVVSQIFDEAANILAQEKALKIRNLGNFNVKKKEERPGVNLSNMTPIMIPARKVVQFSLSRNFRSKLNS